MSYRIVASFIAAAALLAGGSSAGRAAPPPKKKNAAKAKPATPKAQIPVMPAKPPATWLTYHLAHPGPGGTYPADPNCALFWKGRYHLHYIYQPGRYNHCYAHVSSTDMLHWTWQPTTLTTSFTHHGMFSGTGFLTKEGRPAVIYHGLGSGRNQISFAEDDNLEKWTKPYPLEAKTSSGQPAPITYWDPDCWVNGDTYYAISGGKPASLMKSSDLKNWKYLGKLMHDDMPSNLGVSRDEDISCPNMFKIGDKWMLLCISHGLGCRYYLGTFKDENYLPTFHGRMNWKGGEFFAPESLLTPDGRRVMWAWLQMGARGLQGGIQSLPRELSLPADGVLRIKPLTELDTLRYDEKGEAGVDLKSDAPYPLKEIAGDTLEIKAVIAPGAAKQIGVQVYCDAEGKGGFPIVVDTAGKTISLGSVKAPFELKPGEDLTLRVYLDKSLVEAFANDRQAVAAMAVRKTAGAGVRLFSRGGDAVAKEVKGWKMKSIYAPAAPAGT